MKAAAIFVLLVAGTSALPQDLNAANEISFLEEEWYKILTLTAALKNERVVTGAIASAIEELSQSIKDAGLDPLHIQRLDESYALPVPVIFNAQGAIEEFLFHGLSNIVINQLSFNVITTRLRFEISLPLIEASVASADLNAVLFGKNYNAAVSGRFAIRNISLTGNVQVSIGIISGISIRNLDIGFKLGGIDSALNIYIAGRDLSARTNTFLGTTVPTTLRTFENDINELIEIIALDIINGIL